MTNKFLCKVQTLIIRILQLATLRCIGKNEKLIYSDEKSVQNPKRVK